MELVNDFTVNTPIDEAWTILTDVERIAPCLPGAQLEEVEGDVYRGVVKVKVGPITAQFKGEAKFIERDPVAHKAVLHAKGRDTGGKGNADATITAQLASVSGHMTRCTVTTDLNITGKVAQFGRGALADVSNKLLGQFVDNLETMVLSQPAAPAPTPKAKPKAATKAAAPKATRAAAPAEPAVAEEPAEPEPAIKASTSEREIQPAVRKIEQRDVAPVDLLDAAGAPLAKRLAPIVVLVVLVLLWRGRRRRRRHRRAAALS